MSGGEPKQWKFGTRDLFLLTTTIAIGFGAVAYAVKNSVSTFSQFFMLLTGWHVLVGCVAASLWWLRYGTTSDIIEGFVLGMIVAAVLPLLVLVL